MTDKRKQKLRTQLRPGLHEEVISDLFDVLSGMSGEFQADYLREVVLSKYVGPETDTPELRRARAIEKWLKTEHRNAKTNVRMYSSETDFGFCTSDDILEFARRIVTKVIGAEPPRDLLGSFSGGASTRHKRDVGVTARKFMGQADVTEEGWPFILPYLLECSGWLSLNPEVLMPRYVEGNVMFTVPKSTVIDRVACKEPDLNMFVQKGVGDFFRKRLKRFGIDLNDQSINRQLAREGSKDGTLATIDLSSASDSVSTGLVGRLLPPGWFTLLDAIRCKRTVIDGELHENNMFSSMGNGFTFELESLIFYSLARAIAYFSRIRGRISVYGDDIIVPVKMAARLARCFSFFGFAVNNSKSFWTGRFRESCGGHYHRGADVTPFYVKEPIQTMDRLIHFLNRLRKWAANGFDDLCDPRVLDLWKKYAKLVDHRLYGGSNVTDPTQLVSRHQPRFKLVKFSFRAKKLEGRLALGLYLMELRRLTTAPMEISDLRMWATQSTFKTLGTQLEVETEDWVLRRASPSWVKPPLWFTEGEFL